MLRLMRGDARLQLASAAYCSGIYMAVFNIIPHLRMAGILVPLCTPFYYFSV